MLETDKTSLIGRAANATPPTGFRLDGQPSTAATADAQFAILMWLAGGGYRPVASRSKTPRPASKRGREQADEILTVSQPEEPVAAASLRADVLIDLNRYAPLDPRVEDIFAADNIVVVDPRTGWLVTESMLHARIGLFDSLNTLLQKPYLSDEACAALRVTLVTAFAHLSMESQREWAHSECRLEQGLRFLEARAPSEIVTLAEELRPVDERRGIWSSMRLFSIAAQMGCPVDAPISPVASLLTMKDEAN